MNGRAGGFRRVHLDVMVLTELPRRRLHAEITLSDDFRGGAQAEIAPLARSESRHQCELVARPPFGRSLGLAQQQGGEAFGRWQAAFRGARGELLSVEIVRARGRLRRRRRSCLEDKLFAARRRRALTHAAPFERRGFRADGDLSEVDDEHV